MARLNMTAESLAKACRLYSEDSSLRSELRFGQYIWNKFGPVGQSWPELFYETDNGKAYEMAFKQAVLSSSEI